MFRNWWGRSLPENYLSFDFETTGLKKDWDLPIDIGYTIVRDRKAVETKNFILNWAEYPGVQPGWLEERIGRVVYVMRKKGSNFDYSLKRVREEGLPPEKVLRHILRLFWRERKISGAFVGHNAWSFDAVMLKFILKTAIDDVWNFERNELFDTGGIEKAMLGEVFPHDGNKSLKDYFIRIRERRITAKWNIEACAEKYGIMQREDISMEDFHGAGSDSFVSHLIFEEHRKVIESLGELDLYEHPF